MVEWFLDIGNTDRRHLLAVPFIIVFQLIAKSKRMVRNSAVVQPLLARKGVKVHLDRHEFADTHGLEKFAKSQCRVVIPVAIDAVRDIQGNRVVAPVHIERVETQAVLADVIAELETRIFRQIVNERSLQVRKFVIQVKVQKANRIAEVEHVANISGTARKHPAHRPLVALGMELRRERADFHARLAEPFVHRILATGAAVHLEHGTQAVTVLRRETALVELDIVDTFDQEGAEKSEEMHRGINDRIVEQEEVLVGGSATHINLGTEIGTCHDTRERLDALDDIGFGKARHALDRLCGNNRFTGFTLGAAAQLHHDFLELGDFRIVACREEGIDVRFFGSRSGIGLLCHLRGIGALRGVPARRGSGCRVNGRSEGKAFPFRILRSRIYSKAISQRLREAAFATHINEFVAFFLFGTGRIGIRDTDIPERIFRENDTEGGPDRRLQRLA